MNPIELVSHLGAWGQQHQQTVLYGLGAVPLLLGGASLLRKRVAGDPTTHGSARWATYREVKRAGLTGRHGVVVGRMRGRLLYDDGNTHVVRASRTFELVAKNPLGEEVYASPAVSHGELFLRGTKHLFCIGK